MSDGGTLAYRGFQEATATFAGTCSGPSASPVPVTGSARYFEPLEAGMIDCGEPNKPGSLAGIAAMFCNTD